MEEGSADSAYVPESTGVPQGTSVPAAPELPSAFPDTLPPEIIAGGGAALLWVFFWFAFVITAGFAFGLIYHWLRYGFMYPLSFLALPIYGIGVLVLVGGMLAGIGSI